MSSDVSWHIIIRDKLWPMPKHGSVLLYSLRLQKLLGSLGQKAQDGHLDFHTAPELWYIIIACIVVILDLECAHKCVWF